MGRYTSVQRFDDHSLVKIPYSQANAKAQEDTAEDKRTDAGDNGDGDIGNESHQPVESSVKPQSARPERVQNVMGSCAGAGSGEFHMYRYHRRKELVRLEAMNNEEKGKRLIKDQKEKMAEAQAKIATQSAKRAAKRHKKKHRAKKLKESVKDDNGDNIEKSVNDDSEGNGNEEEGEEEFTYIPLTEQNILLENDGGFLERATSSIDASA